MNQHSLNTVDMEIIDVVITNMIVMIVCVCVCVYTCIQNDQRVMNGEIVRD